MLGILVVFVVITVGLLSGMQTRRIDAFLPAYLTAMFVCDSITAILLFAQFSILRLRAILVIASAYLFTALILIPYVLTFPGVFVSDPGNWRSAECGMGVRSVALWFSPVRHRLCLVEGCGLPANDIRRRTPRAAIGRSVALTAGLVSVAAFVCIAGERTIAPHHARPHPFQLAVALSCRGAHRVGKHFAPSSCSGFAGAQCSIFG